MKSLGRMYWLKALAISAGAVLVIGLPTRLIPNPLFVRMIPTRPIDYVIFALSIALIGLTWALPRDLPNQSVEKRSVIAGIGTFFAVGCPTCNKLILLLLGSGGALSYFAPIQPILGIASIALIATALWRRLGTVAV